MRSFLTAGAGASSVTASSSAWAGKQANAATRASVRASGRSGAPALERGWKFIGKLLAIGLESLRAPAGSGPGDAAAPGRGASNGADSEERP